MKGEDEGQNTDLDRRYPGIDHSSSSLRDAFLGKRCQAGLHPDGILQRVRGRCITRLDNQRYQM